MSSDLIVGEQGGRPKTIPSLMIDTIWVNDPFVQINDHWLFKTCKAIRELVYSGRKDGITPC